MSNTFFQIYFKHHLYYEIFSASPFAPNFSQLTIPSPPGICWYNWGCIIYSLFITLELFNRCNLVSLTDISGSLKIEFLYDIPYKAWSQSMTQYVVMEAVIEDTL